MWTLLKDERGQVDIWVALLILAGVVAALGLGAVVALVASIFILTPVALFVFIWKRTFPFARGIAEWTANRINFIPFVLFMLIIINAVGILLTIWIILYWQTGHIAFILLALPLVPLLGLALIIFGVPLGLAITLWLIRLNHHLFNRFKTRFLTFAFKMVMRRAMRHQEVAAKPQKKAKRRPLRIRRRQNRLRNQQQKPENPQKRAENPESRGEKPQRRVKKRRWGAKRRQ